MDIAGVREAVRRAPFVPFTLRLADGRKIPVRHPEFAAVGERRIIVISPNGSSWTVIEPLLIVSIDYRNGNGHKRNPRRARPK